MHMTLDAIFFYFIQKTIMFQLHFIARGVMSVTHYTLNIVPNIGIN